MTTASAHGIQFPAADAASRGSSQAGTRIVAAALHPLDPVLAERVRSERQWRRNYPQHIRALVRHALPDPELAIASARAGLDCAWDTLHWADADGRRPLGEAWRALRPPPLHTLRVAGQGWAEFVLPATNGCFECYRSFVGGPVPRPHEKPTQAEFAALLSANFFPPSVLAWMRTLPFWYEDKHAIYVHAGLTKKDNRFLHPSEVDNPQAMLWVRTEEFFRSYRGKPVVVGHTTTSTLPPELSSYTPTDPTDMWAGEAVYAIDTGCGKQGFLTCLELPEMTVYESR